MITLAQADGKLPNLALARIAAWARSRGEDVRLVRPGDRRTLWDRPSAVYGSSVFAFSAEARSRLDAEWGPIVWGGTGVDVASDLATVDPSTPWDYLRPDWSPWPEFHDSIGFTSRGCRQRCAFCVVPQKEGRVRAVMTIEEVWRGEPWPRRILLLDNDFFGQAEWRDRVRELRAGRFKVCFSQGINLRLVDDEIAEALASIEYRDDSWRERRLHTAWDHLRDERAFLCGFDALIRAGVRPRHLMVYMLVGFDPTETWGDIWHRWRVLVGLGCEPYPMVYDRTRVDLRAFQRWTVTGLYRAVPWPEFREPRLTADVRAAADAAWSSAA